MQRNSRKKASKNDLKKYYQIIAQQQAMIANKRRDFPRAGSDIQCWTQNPGTADAAIAFITERES
ncbi:hypothetical protein [Microcoleus sp. BROC3]|uniref:hypothetical protein n=1 Tax=Microcoleus sp. BROC3 TaxID=3055323 RepID=UPI002FCF3330